MNLCHPFVRRLAWAIALGFVAGGLVYGVEARAAGSTAEAAAIPAQGRE